MATISLTPDVSPIRQDRFGYWNGHLLVTPLVSEDMLATFFLKMKSDNLLDRVFSEATASLTWWMQHYQREDVCTLACMKEDPVTKKMTMHGMGWIVNRTNVGNVFYKAEVGECYERGTSPRDTIRYGRMMIDYSFEKLNLLALYGTTPEPNVAGVRYARMLEFDVHGPFPNYTTWVNSKTGQREPCASYVSVMSKDKWEARSWR